MNKFFKIYNKYGVLLILLILTVIFWIINPAFMTIQNMINILKQVSIIGVVAVGMTFVLLSDGIDLSVGGVISLVCITLSLYVAEMGVPVGVAMVLVLLQAVLVGLINGVIIAKIKVPPLIMTLGTCTFLEGFNFTICGGLPVYGLPASLKWTGQYNVFGKIPVLVIAMLLMLAIGVFILNKTYLGRYFYAIGSNEEATRLTGINADRIRIMAYTLSGLMAGVAGILMLGRIGSGQPGAGDGYEMDVLTGCVLGGVSLSGGKGKLSNAFVGILIIGVLSNGMAIAGMGTFPQKMVKGIVLIFAVVLDRLQYVKVRKKVKVNAA